MYTRRKQVNLGTDLINREYIHNYVHCDVIEQANSGYRVPPSFPVSTPVISIATSPGDHPSK